MALTFSVAVAHTNSQANAEHKLQFLSAEYANGAELEQVANEKKAMLEAQLQEAGRVLGADVVRTKEDEVATLTGEQATARTGT